MIMFFSGCLFVISIQLIYKRYFSKYYTEYLNHKKLKEVEKQKQLAKEDMEEFLRRKGDSYLEELSKPNLACLVKLGDCGERPPLQFKE